jgi:predicted RND superfamily exporter protein
MVRKAPPELKSLRQTAGRGWTWMPSEIAFYNSAISGIFLSMFFAFLILCIATRNLTQSVISIFCVCTIVVSVVAIMQMKGWQLGTAESVSVVMLIGFSVDYVIHLSADYSHSSLKSRHDKIQQAYTEMGVSITSGAITTFGSGMFLFGGFLILFRKFAVLITSTVAISYFVSMLFFGAMEHSFGPESFEKVEKKPNEDGLEKK